MTATTAGEPDWLGWYARWEAQQARHMPDRDERFAVMVAALGGFCGDHPHVVDLGCGPGSLAKRILDAIPGARVTAVDMDPVLLAIGAGALGDCDGRLRFVDADLRGPWEASLDGPVDAAVSTTALHWLSAPALAALYGRLGRVMRPGGVVLNGDSLPFDDDEPRIAGVVRSLREARAAAVEAAPVAGETWEEWWAAVDLDPALAAPVADRRHRLHDHPDHEHPATLAFHRRSLADAGFGEIDTLWQHLTDRVLVAVR